MQPGAVLLFFFSPFSVFKNYCKSVHSFLFGTAARQWSSQADHMLFSHYGTQALVFPKQPLCAATAAKIYLQHHQLLEVSRGERKCKKSTKPELARFTHRGREFQLQSFSVALLKELARHQLSHLKRDNSIRC